MEQELLSGIPVMDFPQMNFESFNFIGNPQNQELDFQ
jgi:hypothetical protein